MRRLQSVISALTAVGLLASCANDPTGDLRGTPTAISPSIGFAVVPFAQQKFIDLQVRDEQGNALVGSITAVSSNPDSVSVEVDTTFRPGLGGSRLTTRFILKGLKPDSATITFSAAGIADTSTPAIVDPNGGAVSNISVATDSIVGDTLTLTVIGHLRFSAATTLSFNAGGLPALVTDVDPSGLSLRFIAQPGSKGSPVVDGVSVPYAAQLDPASISSVEQVAIQPLTSYPLLASATNVGIGGLVTLTTQGPYRFTPASVAFSQDTNLTVITGALSADSTQLTIQLGPNFVNDTIKVDNIVVGTAPTLGSYTMQPDTLTVFNTPAPPAAIAGTFSSATPQVGAAVTLTGTGFVFLPGATVTFGAGSATVTGISADSTQITFIPQVGSTGAATITGVALATFPVAPLTLPTVATLTVANTSFWGAGTNSLATAPTFTMPASGASNAVADLVSFSGVPECTGNFGDNCQVYKFVLGAATTFTVTANWSNQADLGIYFMDAGGAGVGTSACDAHGAGGTAHPETCTQSLAAGTYYMAVVTFADFYAPPFDVDPTDFYVKITAQ